jgi:hypothetical protein
MSGVKHRRLSRSFWSPSEPRARGSEERPLHSRGVKEEDMRAISSAAAALALTMATSTALADDLTVEDLPPPVQQTVQREVGEGHITDIDREHHGERLVYEVEFDRDQREYKLKVAPDGRVVRMEEDR